MQTHKIKLPPDTYLSEIEPFKTKGIPSNSIIHKKVTGCGITTFEVRFAKHNSIIILPNVPVIENKVKKHNIMFPHDKILGVHKGIDTDDIRAYLLTDVKHKKILTTPEGFISKVIKAFEKQPEVMLNDYFLLYDECERIITDISYRGNIAAPLDLFFKFKNKALVSATTLPFSDSRFDDFEHYIIEPSYDFSKELSVIATNNVIASLKKHIAALNSKHHCIFVNSTKIIIAIIEALNIADESRVYCAQDSVVTLLSNGFTNGSSKLDTSEMVKYNFFTSRYFSAVDIEVSYKPNVILMTDVIFAEHSILDPHTEVVQIAGRFRNGISSLTHISNFNPELKSKSQEEAIYYLNGCFDTYNSFVKSHHASSHPGSRDMLLSAIESSPAHSFYTNGKLNSFMVDNYINEERVKGYYQKFDNLQAAYNLNKEHFSITFQVEEYSLGDRDRLLLQSKKTKKEISREVAKQIDNLTSKFDSYVFAPEGLLEKFTDRYPLLVEGVRVIGIEGLEAADYVDSRIKSAIAEKKKNEEIAFLSPKVYRYFNKHRPYNDDYILEKLQAIYAENNIMEPARKSHILKYFEGIRSTRSGVRVHVLRNKLFKNGKPNSDISKK
jgi:hypothetical protein